ncbi:MAG: hypothetical protein N2C12_17990, partial [Planctomycetales bacterium]
MASNYWLLIQGDDRWHVGRYDGSVSDGYDVDLPAGSDPAATVDLVAGCLTEHGYRGEPLILGLQSSSCLSACFSAETGASQSHQSLMYSLEEWLPLAAEDMVADFVVARNSVFGVAVRKSSTKQLVELFENAGVEIQVIAPAVLLGLHSMLSQSASDTTQLLLWQNGDTVDLIKIADNQANVWEVLPASPTAIADRLNALVLQYGQDLDIRCNGLGDELLAVIAGLPDLNVVDTTDLSLHEAALDTAEKILRGRIDSMINLCRDALASTDPYRPVRRHIHFATCLGVLFLLSTAAIFFYRGIQYDRIRTDAIDAQTDIYRKVFPKGSIPIGI